MYFISYISQYEFIAHCAKSSLYFALFSGGIRSAFIASSSDNCIVCMIVRKLSKRSRSMPQLIPS